MLQNKAIIFIMIAVIGTLGAGILTFAIGLSGSPCQGVYSVTRNFTIIANTSGFNDSKDHQGSWPVLRVDRCDLVSITIVNNDVQSHGFAIDYYGAKGAEIQGQQSYLFPVFQAIKQGQFSVRCNVFCTVHTLMQSGLLVVS